MITFTACIVGENWLKISIQKLHTKLADTGFMRNNSNSSQAEMPLT